ncbi:MAG: M16 family metallopeptidase, partial [Actinomycetota bacterium]
PPPGASGTQVPASEKEPWRSRVPAPAPAEPVIPPAAKEFELKNGLKVFVAPSRSLPLVTARLVARSGSASDPPELPGVTDFMAAMLNESAGSATALDIADDLTSLGSTLETAASKERSWIDIVSLTPKLDSTMQIMRDVALSPTFAPAEIERVRNERLVALRQQRDRPMTVAYKVMWRELYGAGHPYAHLDLGTEQAIGSIRREDLQAAYRRVFGPKNSALIFAGDISPAEAKRLAAEYFGGWSEDASRPGLPPAPGPAQERVFIVDQPGSPQTSVLAAQIAVPRSDPDFPKLAVMNRTLGGLFSSRLNQNLRESNGYTYGAGSEITQNRAPGNLRISTAVNAEFTGPAVREVLREVERLKRNGVTEQELMEATDSILFSVAELFDTNSSTVDTISNLYTLGLGQDNLRGLPGRLKVMSVSSIGETAARYLTPDAMKIVLVGDRAKIEPQLSPLGLGRAAHRTPDGSPA